MSNFGTPSATGMTSCELRTIIEIEMGICWILIRVWLNGHDETAFANHVYPGVAPSMQNLTIPTISKRKPGVLSDPNFDFYDSNSLVSRFCMMRGAPQ
jgi:hypothetical protein